MTQADVGSFIRSVFRSVWALELLLFLRGHADRAWSKAEMVAALRASEAVVTGCVDQLVVAGLIATEVDGTARYAPAARDLDDMAGRTEELYAKSPDAVRRMIVMSAQGGLAAFADAFRLRKD